MHKRLLTMLFAVVGLTATAQTKLTKANLEALAQTKSYANVSVHDPSIVYDEVNKKYVVIGSHLGMGESSDMVTWSGVNTGYEHATLLGKSFRTAFDACPEHTVKVKRGSDIVDVTMPSFNAGDFCSIYAADRGSWISGDMWAPDIVYNPNMKKWCMYLSLNGDNWASVIVLLTSDNAKGPYKYEAPIVFSGFNGVSYGGKKVDVAKTDMSIVTGSTTVPTRFTSAGSKWGTYYPNCIDPCSFFDADGELWLAYGSWSGGIWMLKLDKNTGLRDYTTTYSGTTLNANATSDQYFGKKIAGGYYVSGEGPYIQKIGDYYYLFMSYGFMVAGYDNYGTASQKTTGGYEMRVFRSDKPDGTYKDASGNSAIYSSYQLNYGKTSATNRGMRLLGAMQNWPGFAATGETAQGHNSAIVDGDGNAFLVYHTKFDNSKNNNYGHQLRVQQLYQNEYGWLCASPFRHNGVVTTQNDIDSKRLFTAEEVAGTYGFIRHPYKLDWANWEWSTPGSIMLTADGKIYGDVTGTWAFTKEDKSYIKIIIGGVIYYGVVTEQKDYRYNDMPTLCITAVSNSGLPIWLYSHIGKAALADSYATLSGYAAGPIVGDVPSCNHVKTEFVVKNYTTKEDESETLSSTGIFTPTTDGHKVTVAMTASAGNYCFTYGGYLGIATAKGAEYYPESQQKNTTAGWWQNFSTEDYTLNAGESLVFQFVNNSDAKENFHNWCLCGNSEEHSSATRTEYFCVRNDGWDNTSASNTGCVSNFNWNTFKTDMNCSTVRMVVNLTTAGVFTMTAKITTATGLVYTYEYTKTISAKPASIKLCFVNEGSYIDGSGLQPTDVYQVATAPAVPMDGIRRNIAGQVVDENYRGIVIVNGKKYNTAY